MTHAAPPQPTIGVFDSGFGGLTVLRALFHLLPSARYLYLGDTARLPYGSKSRETIARYAVSSARFLLEGGADLLVIACNTATALALEDIRSAAAPIPVLGVIEPGAEAAAKAVSQTPSVVLSETRIPFRTDAFTTPIPAGRKSLLASNVTLSGAKIPHMSLAAPREPASQPPQTGPERPPHAPATVLVLATAATVQSAAYTQALASLGVGAIEKACPLLVPLVEEGWIDHPVTREVARIYLAEALAEARAQNVPQDFTLTTLLLGCTHYPLLRPLLEQTLASLGHPLHVIDSATATAEAAATLLPPGPTPVPLKPISPTPACTFYATDSVGKFQTLGSRFLGQPLPEVHLIDLGG